MMCVLCKCKTPVFEEILRIVLTDAEFEENPYLEQFEKYNLLKSFWRITEDLFGYSDPVPTLEKLTLSMFATYADKSINADLPTSWSNYVCGKAGNNIAFLDNLMNNYLYSGRFDEISAFIYEKLRGDSELRKLPADALVGCSLFAGVDEILIQWITERLLLEDTSAKLAMKTILELVQQRRQTHFGGKYQDEYFMLENAWNLIANPDFRSHSYKSVTTLNTLAADYTKRYYKMDRWYRGYYEHLDQMKDASPYEALTELIENIYSNDYLGRICLNWSELYAADSNALTLPKQQDFYRDYLSRQSSRTVVIISDAMRYEVGVDLFELLQSNEKNTASITAMQTVLPSITKTGMAALLPHHMIELDKEYNVTVDGESCASTAQRQKILQGYKPKSRCIQFDELWGMNQAELREVFTGQEVVYVYHNQVDARGDAAHTENEVFVACKEAVKEIDWLIHRLTTSANTTHYIVTSDHGFLYKRRKLEESDKISHKSHTEQAVGKRYYLAEAALSSVGAKSVPMRNYYQNEERFVSFPSGSDIFITPGAGVNFVHGGCSPQEMLIPLIEVKTKKGRKETTTAHIALISLTTKITNLITQLDFVQTEAVSDVVKETTYRLYFVDSTGQKISNEQIYIANKKATDTAKRVFRLKFTFKNQKYNRFQNYYLVAQDDFNGMEVIRHEVIMDIAFADDFGFGF
jgi:uncharacterized protein (TIGR02687 family)